MPHLHEGAESRFQAAANLTLGEAAGFKSEWVAAFKSEYPAGFVGIRRTQGRRPFSDFQAHFRADAWQSHM
jgi:hypothetical protein